MVRICQLLSRAPLILLCLVGLLVFNSPTAVKADGPWSNLGSLAGDGALNNQVLAIAVSGTDVYVGGTFQNAGGDPAADYIAKWNGTSWEALGRRQICDPFGYCHDEGVLTSTVWAIAIDGTNVYVGGTFIDAAGISNADALARWDTTTRSWSAVGGTYGPNNDGALNVTGSGGVNALAFANGNLYVGGSFRNAANIPEADVIVRWDGTNWNALGSYVFQGQIDGAVLCTDLDMNGNVGPCRNASRVNAIAVDGTNVYVGCSSCWDVEGQQTWDNLLVWDGSAWSGLGSGTTCDGWGNCTPDGAIKGAVFVRSLAIAPDGSLYAGGNFTNVADLPDANYLARWNGSTWSAVGSSGGFGAFPAPSDIKAFAFFGNDIYVGGMFTNANGNTFADGIVKWNGSAWSALGSNGAGDGAMTYGCCAGTVSALAMSSNDLFVGGGFTNAAGIASADNIARWNIAPPNLTGITVTPANSTIPAGTTQQFTATGTYSDASTGNVTSAVTWDSSNPAAATVNGAGLAQALAQGASYISATLGQMSGSATLNVSAPTLASIAVAPTNPTIASGGTQQFTATGTFSDASTQDLTTTANWSSGTPGVASIGLHTGLANGLATGTSLISASFSGKSASTTLTVGGPMPTLTYTGPTSAAPGATITLSATLFSGSLKLPSRTVTFTMNGVTLSATTNKSAAASVRMTAPTAPGQYPIQVTFAGDGFYSPASTSSNLSVKVATKLTYTGPTRVSGGAAITLSARLTTASGAAISGAQVAFTLNGATLQATTNASGVAAVASTAPTAAGKYAISVSYAGTAANNAASASSSLTVR